MPKLPLKPSANSRLNRQHLSDIRGLVQLTRQATLNTTRIVEGVHQSVWRTLGLPGGEQPGTTRGITGLVYRSIDGVTRLVSAGTDTALAGLQQFFIDQGPAAPESPQREALIAALNGVMGDRLEAENSPFATDMALRCNGAVLSEANLPDVTNPKGKLLLLVHGLCMNDLQWRRELDGKRVDHGSTVATELGYTPIYLRYNSGLPIARNAATLAKLLETLVKDWPVEVAEVSVVAHSMGGLLTRHAIDQATRSGADWPGRVRKVVFLGTPHLGAPLEKAGAWVQTLLGATPYSAPFVSLSGLRSVGITDLRHGASGAEVPLTHGIDWYSLAATTTAQRGVLADNLTGDGLVPLRSALGESATKGNSLDFSKTNIRVVYGVNHMALLSHPQVSGQLLNWLGPSDKP